VNDEPEHMHVKPTFKNEFNLTTATLALGLVAVIGGWIWTASDVNASIRSWITNHEEIHKAAAAAIAGNEQRTDQRLITLEGQTRKMEQLEYRVTVQEQGSASLARSVEELKNTVNGQSADIRVMLEILKRLDGVPNGK
jgi:uncharacterized coiled-coil protein SlyX